MAGPASPHERVARVLNHNAWFSRRPAELRRQLIQRAQVSTVDAGHWLYDKGDEARGLYGVLSGSVTTLVALDNGENVPVNISGPGTIFGYAAQILGGHRVATAIARERSEIIFIPQHALAAIAHEQPSLWIHFAELATEQLIWAVKIIAERSRLSPRARLAARLYTYATTWGDTDGEVSLPIRQDELAELSGLSRKTVNGFLRDFEKKGFVALGYREIEVRDLRGLKQCIQSGD
ncbi:cyclic nucleotide-binding domain-containing protein [Parvibaculum sedimenti]|uniref:Cyclic nucleotide-binding domain-containing protein n=1 Tax=Parvibaculum sedimenti TaxID=2608632 RepID=A0A6N6VLQ9_9HYPH|nr:Crp/Fnr family transcriptional regulator [Parvibaculum sedimenti]KAB7741667.1 cyclic nucleotide-binding domain-containing protein [Parvibaculum sedimenti]